MKFRPGVVPQCPSSRGLMSSRASGSAQQWVVQQVDLADGQVVGRPPPPVDLREGFVGESAEDVELGLCAHEPINCPPWLT